MSAVSTSAARGAQAAAPRAARRPQTLGGPGGRRRVDELGWLRDKTDPAVIEHLQAENVYTDQMLAATGGLQQTLFEEIRARVVEDDDSAPVLRGRFEYFRRTRTGQEYPILCRRPIGSAGDEQVQVLLDVNELAAGSEYCALGMYDLSADETVLLYSVDLDGSESYSMRVRQLPAAGPVHAAADRVVVPAAAAGGSLLADGSGVLYLLHDAAHRPHEVWHVALAEPETSEPRLLHREDDERFFLSVGLTLDAAYVVVSADSKVTSEVWLAPAADPSALVSVCGRRYGIEYSVHSHAPSGRLLMLTNDGAVDFRVLQASAEQVLAGSNGASAEAAQGVWSELLAGQDGLRYDDLLVLAEHVVLAVRWQASTQLRVLDLRSGQLRELEQAEQVATVELAGNELFDTDRVRYTYQSLTTPAQVLLQSLRDGSRSVLKSTHVPGLDSSAYVSERRWARSADGTQVPVSLVYRRDRPADADGALVYAYGSYEASMDPWFSVARLSLLDRGVLFALVHPRGGGELGRAWYTGGKFGEKNNTFADVQAAMRMLREQDLASRLVLRGGSAGGLMVGAVLNQAPELLVGAVAEVPFVDCLNTMCDPSLPLTVTEYDEWGDPTTAQGYDWIASYAPYEQLQPRPYPPVLATAGLNDPRVGFWEPAKWVQRLREVSPSPVLLRCEMGAGHGGPSGRYASWREEAEVMAFVLASLQGSLSQL